MKQSIVQKDDFGCGAACVAFAANTTYKEAVKLLGHEKAKTRGYYCKELVYALKYFGLKYEYRYVNYRVKRNLNKDSTIVFIKRCKRYPFGHYLIRCENKWMDPWINLDSANPDIVNAKSGFRNKLPGKAEYIIFKSSSA